jgi:Animal haem peroxidase
MGRATSAARRLWPAALAVSAALAVAPAVEAKPPAPDPAATQSSFGRMFPALPGFTTPTDLMFHGLVQTQLDPGPPESEEEADPFDNEDVPAGFTYFGQFIDHDLTRDQQPTPTTFIDPTTLKNFRTARFDLDSVYGGGPKASPHLYTPRNRILIQEENSNGIADLARDDAGVAIIGDNRNDENVIIAQLHVAVAKFHNRLMDDGHSFAEAQKLTRWHYQFVVVNDYLPHVAGADRVSRFLKPDGTVRSEFYDAGDPAAPMTPVEFASAIFRYGHSQVRDAYELNDETEEEPVPVFRLDGSLDLRGGRDIAELLEIDWSEFFAIQGAQEFEGNLARKFDTKISESLFQLPIGSPGLPPGSNVLGFRNLNRGKFYGLPAGQDVAKAMGIRPLTNGQLGLGPEWGGKAPLWYYILAESELREDGERLGDVSGRIVSEVFLGQLAADSSSYLSQDPSWQPTVEHDGAFDIGEFLKFAGVVELEEEEEE